jgi:murein DD-endopeptidase MepM/ murein hydrolase activator NlpD
VDPTAANPGPGVSGDFARPLPTKLGGASYGYSDPEGQGGRHLAHDWFAPGGTPLASPVSGQVFRVKPDPNPGQKASGQVYGGSVYIRGNDGKVWVFRHVESPEKYFQAGARVRAGQRIGSVKPWSGSSHAHIELYKPGPYEYSPARAMNPYDYFRSRGIS